MSAIVFIPLTQGKVAVIDFSDFETVRKYKWHAHQRGRCWYAGSGALKGMQMHRLLLGAPRGVGVDHLDGDGLNNQRHNLRLASKTQNGQAARRKAINASSKFRGVNLKTYVWRGSNKCTLRWTAQIRLNKKSIHIGYFSSEEAAARAYDKKARELFGEYAAPNFPI